MTRHRFVRVPAPAPKRRPRATPGARRAAAEPLLDDTLPPPRERRAQEARTIDLDVPAIPGDRPRSPPRWNADPDEVQRSLLKLVLTLVEFLRQLMERQAIRRVEQGTLTEEETEAVGLALMRLEETIGELCEQFQLDPDDLNLDLGPLGPLM